MLNAHPNNPSRRIKAVLFDLDGTILDSIEGILASFQHTITQHVPTFKPTRRDLIMTIGEPLHVQMRSFADGDAVIAERMVATYREHNLAILPGFGLYEGAKATIEALRMRGFITGLVTSKSILSARISLDGHALWPLFDIVMTTEDTSKHKPDPMPLIVAAERLAIRTDELLYVGDSVHDIHCAHGAGAAAIAALWGPFEPATLAALNPRHQLRQFTEILDLPELQILES